MHTRSRLIVTVVLSLTCAAVPLLAQFIPPPPNRSVSRLRSGIGLCIKPVNGMSSFLGDRVEQVPCDPYDPSYFWSSEFAGNANGAHQFRLRNEGNLDLCLDNTDGKSIDRNPLQMWACTTSTTMQWSFPSSGMIPNRRASSKCIDVPAATTLPGAIIQIYRCAYRDSSGQVNQAQQWHRY
jgi:hypothetical protein